MRTPVRDFSGEIDRVLIESEAQKSGSRYALVVQYVPGETWIDVEFSLYDGSENTPLAVRSLSSPIDIDLDSRVSEVVRDLIAVTDLDRERTAGTSLEGFSLQEAPPSSSRTPAAGFPGQPVGTQSVAGVDLAVLTSGLLLLGEASELFTYGVAGTLAGGYRAPLDRVGLTFGARGSFIHALANEGVEGGSLYVVTVGPDARIGTPYRTPARLSARVSGGAAIVIVSRAEETLAKTELFAESGVGARLPLGPRFAIGLELNFIIVFEPDLPLMGVSPSLTVSMEP